MRCRTRLRPQILADEARTTGWAGELGPREAAVGGSLRARREGGRARAGATCGNTRNDGFASGLAGSGEDRPKRCRARRWQRPLRRSGSRGAALGVVPLGKIQQATAGERIGRRGNGADLLRETLVELLLHDTALNITAQS